MSKPPLVFIHGFRGDHSGLDPVANQFSDYKTYTFDLPPFGNAGTLNSYTPKPYADYVINFIRKHQLVNPVLVGHSMGSIIAAAVAEYYPSEINHRLILASPIPQKTSRLLAKLGSSVLFLPNSILSLISTVFLFVPKNSALFKKVLQKVKKSGSKSSSLKDIKLASRFAANYSIADFHFAKQTCFISGDKDRLVSKTATKNLAQKLGAKLHFIKNTGHLINYENPKAVAKLIKDFLEQT